MQTDPLTPPTPVQKRFPWRGALISFTLLVAFLALVAWGMASRSDKALALGQPAPDFTLTAFDGQVYDTRELRGRVIMVNFWASWCDTCDEEAVFLEQAWQTYGKDGKLLLLGVAYVDTETQSKRFIQQYGVTFPNGPDLRSEISKRYYVTGVPETYIIDRAGNLAYVKIGPFTSLEEIRQVIDPLLQP